MSEREGSPPHADEAAFDALARQSPRAADAPKRIQLPPLLTDGLRAAWRASFPEGRSQEQGGLLVIEPNGGYAWRRAVSGTSRHFVPNYDDLGAGETLAATAHTHPYDATEGGDTAVSFSGDDLANLVWHQERMKVVRSGATLFLMTKTAEFEQLVDGASSPVERDALQAAMNDTWNDAFAAAKGRFGACVAAAGLAVCRRYRLVLYRGRGHRVVRTPAQSRVAGARPR